MLRVVVGMPQQQLVGSAAVERNRFQVELDRPGAILHSGESAVEGDGFFAADQLIAIPQGYFQRPRPDPFGYGISLDEFEPRDIGNIFFVGAQQRHADAPHFGFRGPASFGFADGYNRDGDFRRQRPAVKKPRTAGKIEALHPLGHDKHPIVFRVGRMTGPAAKSVIRVRAFQLRSHDKAFVCFDGFCAGCFTTGLIQEGRCLFMVDKPMIRGNDHPGAVQAVDEKS